MQGQKGMQAANVTKPGGAAVQGIRYRAQRGAGLLGVISHRITSLATLRALTALEKARPNLAGPKAAQGYCHATCRDPIGIEDLTSVG